MTDHPKMPRIIRNPYGKKAPSIPPISTKPLFGAPTVDANTTATEIIPTHANSNDRLSSALEPSTTSEESGLSGLEATKHNGPMSISLQPWERLPSQNLSFGSAEILSIAECVEHAKLYHQQGMSVRCTGILQEVAEDNPLVGGREYPNACLWVRLSDPLHAFGQTLGKTMRPPELWVLFVTPEFTGLIRKTRVGDPVTVLGELVTPTASHEFCLRARLWIPVAPTTNLALQREALLMRRRFLLSNSTFASMARPEEKDAVLRPGCGPPPYAL